MDEEIDETENGPIQESQDISEISTTPLKLPPTFEWVELDIENDDQVYNFLIFIHNFVKLSELYQLLSENYVEDYDSKFRFDYTREVLRWY